MHEHQLLGMSSGTSLSQNNMATNLENMKDRVTEIKESMANVNMKDDENVKYYNLKKLSKGNTIGPRDKGFRALKIGKENRFRNHKPPEHKFHI